MNTNKKRFVLTLLSTLTLLPFCANSGTDPISWKLNQQFENPTHAGRSYSVTYTLTNQLPFQLVKPLVISKNASPKAEFTYVDKCTGQRLAPKASCTVTATLLPLVSGPKELQLTIGGYDNNQIKLPQLTTQTSGSITNEVVESVSQSLPYQMTLGSTANYAFTFTNHSTASATSTAVKVTQSNGGTPTILSNTCTAAGLSSGVLLAGASCTVSGSYLPNSAGTKPQTVSATLTFQGTQGSPSTATTTTTVVNSQQSSALVGSLIPPYYLPPVTVQSKAYPVKFLFTNVSSGVIHFSGLGVGSVTCMDNHSIDCSSHLSAFTSNCNTSLPAPNPTAAACELTATFSAPAATNPATTYTLTANVPFTGGTGSPAEVTTAGTVVTTLSTTRTIKLVNQCSFPVWFSLNGSAVSGVSCNAAGQGCPPGTSCNTSTKSCYWNNAKPNTGTSYMLAKNGGNNTVTIPAHNYGGTQWSGNISASTLCNGSSCAQAACDNHGGTTSCAPGKGFTQPATQAEITMGAATNDSYDVEVINGFHIPIVMQPEYYAGIPATADNYNCGAPGNYAAGNNFGSCNWKNVSLPTPSSGTGKSSGYYWVSGGGKACSITQGTSQCPTNQLCGLSQNTATGVFTQSCGNFLGYWSADQVCSNAGLSAEVSKFFNCSLPLPTASGFPVSSTLYKLMACSVPSGDVKPLYNSCYLSYPGESTTAIETCCGCVDWWNPNNTSGTTIHANQATQSCGKQIDRSWTQYVQPMVQWMKATCPSAYVYPFDDKTSGFSCTNNLPNKPNSTGYTITFCQGNTGLPTGLTVDGRGS